SLVPAVTPMAAAEIRHLHHWTGHLHHRADHAHDVAAAAEAAGDSHAAEAATAARDHAAEATAATTAAFHHLTHHRAHGLHQRGEAALAHPGLHHLQHRRHLGHHVLTAGAAARAATAKAELGVGGCRAQREQQEYRGGLANKFVSTLHNLSPHVRCAAKRCQPDAQGEA